MKKDHTDLKIEKGVPIPPRPSTVGKGYQAVLRLMKVGDSVLLPNKKSARNAAQLAFGAGNYAARTEANGVRVWRTK